MVVYDRPAIGCPGDRSQECFTPKMMKIASVWAKGQTDKPALAIVRFDQVGMPCSLNRVKTTVAMGKNGVVRTGFKRPPRTGAACHSDHMSILRSPFGDHQIIAVVEVVEMGSLGETTAGSFPDAARLRSPLSGLQINFKQINARRLASG